MGCLVEIFTCSICGEAIGLNSCECIKQYGKGGINVEGKLQYQKCHGLEFFENSSVSDPADLAAVGDKIFSL